ncbi:MAG: ABC transporter ATP-binding protein [Candidatus Geothermarchaeales archaeon]
MEETIVDVVNLRKWFPVRKGVLASIFGVGQLYVRAVDDVSFSIGKGEIFGLAGESGCGKTTTGKTLLRLVEPTDGRVYFRGRDVLSLGRVEMKRLRRKMQIIYQDPYESLDPRMTVLDTVSEPLSIHRLIEGASEREERVVEALEEVELLPPEEFLYRYPHELSGGQRQRVAVARALVLGPEFIVADEPVSMLDISIRAEILKLMLKLREDFGISYLFITHDLATARQLCHRIAVMYLGKIVEEAPTEELIGEPLHPYTEALLAAVPVPDPTAERIKITISGEVPSPVSPPPGCRFHPRCPLAIGVCSKEEPELRSIDSKRSVACHLVA